jgi:hypothetical protein
MNVDDILEWKCPKFGNVHRWRVVGIHLGAVQTESLIEMESITHKPGWTGHWEYHPRIWVPEVLVRDLPIVMT